jgi:hypothetical protein
MFNLYPLTREQAQKCYKPENQFFMTKEQFDEYCKVTKPFTNDFSVKLEDLTPVDIKIYNLNINNNDSDKSI